MTSNKMRENSKAWRMSPVNSATSKDKITKTLVKMAEIINLKSKPLKLKFFKSIKSNYTAKQSNISGRPTRQNTVEPITNVIMLKKLEINNKDAQVERKSMSGHVNDSFNNVTYSSVNSKFLKTHLPLYTFTTPYSKNRSLASTYRLDDTIDYIARKLLNHIKENSTMLGIPFPVDIDAVKKSLRKLMNENPKAVQKYMDSQIRENMFNVNSSVRQPYLGHNNRDNRFLNSAFKVHRIPKKDQNFQSFRYPKTNRYDRGCWRYIKKVGRPKVTATIRDTFRRTSVAEMDAENGTWETSTMVQAYFPVSPTTDQNTIGNETQEESLNKIRLIQAAVEETLEDIFSNFDNGNNTLNKLSNNKTTPIKLRVDVNSGNVDVKYAGNFERYRHDDMKNGGRNGNVKAKYVQGNVNLNATQSTTDTDFLALIQTNLNTTDTPENLNKSALSNNIVCKEIKLFQKLRDFYKKKDETSASTVPNKLVSYNIQYENLVRYDKLRDREAESSSQCPICDKNLQLNDELNVIDRLLAGLYSPTRLYSSTASLYSSIQPETRQSSRQYTGNKSTINAKPDLIFDVPTETYTNTVHHDNTQPSRPDSGFDKVLEKPRVTMVYKRAHCGGDRTLLRGDIPKVQKTVLHAYPIKTIVSNDTEPITVHAYPIKTIVPNDTEPITDITTKKPDVTTKKPEDIRTSNRTDVLSAEEPCMHDMMAGRKAKVKSSTGSEHTHSSSIVKYNDHTSCSEAKVSHSTCNSNATEKYTTHQSVSNKTEIKMNRTIRATCTTPNICLTNHSYNPSTKRCTKIPTSNDKLLTSCATKRSQFTTQRTRAQLTTSSTYSASTTAKICSELRTTSTCSASATASTCSESVTSSTHSDLTTHTTCSESTAHTTCSESTAHTTCSESTTPSTCSESTNPSTCSESTNHSASSESITPCSSSESTTPNAFSESITPSTFSESTNPGTSSESATPSTYSESINPNIFSESTTPSAFSDSITPSTCFESMAPNISSESTISSTSSESITPSNCSESMTSSTYSDSTTPSTCSESQTTDTCSESQTSNTCSESQTSNTCLESVTPCTCLEPTTSSTCSESTNPNTSSESITPSTYLDQTMHTTCSESTALNTCSKSMTSNICSESTTPSTWSESITPSASVEPMTDIGHQQTTTTSMCYENTTTDVVETRPNDSQLKYTLQVTDRFSKSLFLIVKSNYSNFQLTSETSPILTKDTQTDVQDKMYSGFNIQTELQTTSSHVKLLATKTADILIGVKPQSHFGPTHLSQLTKLFYENLMPKKNKVTYNVTIYNITNVFLFGSSFDNDTNYFKSKCVHKLLNISNQCLLHNINESGVKIDNINDAVKRILLLRSCLQNEYLTQNQSINNVTNLNRNITGGFTSAVNKTHQNSTALIKEIPRSSEVVEIPNNRQDCTLELKFNNRTNIPFNATSWHQSAIDNYTAKLVSILFNNLHNISISKRYSTDPQAYSADTKNMISPLVTLQPNDDRKRAEYIFIQEMKNLLNPPSTVQDKTSQHVNHTLLAGKLSDKNVGTEQPIPAIKIENYFTKLVSILFNNLGTEQPIPATKTENYFTPVSKYSGIETIDKLNQSTKFRESRNSISDKYVLKTGITTPQHQKLQTTKCPLQSLQTGILVPCTNELELQGEMSNHIEGSERQYTKRRNSDNNTSINNNYLMTTNSYEHLFTSEQNMMSSTKNSNPNDSLPSIHDREFTKTGNLSIMSKEGAIPTALVNTTKAEKNVSPSPIDRFIKSISHLNRSIASKVTENEHQQITQLLENRKNLRKVIENINILDKLAKMQLSDLTEIIQQQSRELGNLTMASKDIYNNSGLRYYHNQLEQSNLHNSTEMARFSDQFTSQQPLLIEELSFTDKSTTEGAAESHLKANEQSFAKKKLNNYDYITNMKARLDHLRQNHSELLTLLLLYPDLLQLGNRAISVKNNTQTRLNDINSSTHQIPLNLINNESDKTVNLEELLKHLDVMLPNRMAKSNKYIQFIPTMTSFESILVKQLKPTTPVYFVRPRYNNLYNVINYDIVKAQTENPEITTKGTSFNRYNFSNYNLNSNKTNIRGLQIRKQMTGADIKKLKNLLCAYKNDNRLQYLYNKPLKHNAITDDLINLELAKLLSPGSIPKYQYFPPGSKSLLKVLNQRNIPIGLTDNSGERNFSNLHDPILNIVNLNQLSNKQSVRLCMKNLNKNASNSTTQANVNVKKCPIKTNKCITCSGRVTTIGVRKHTDAQFLIRLEFQDKQPILKNVSASKARPNKSNEILKYKTHRS